MSILITDLFFERQLNQISYFNRSTINIYNTSNKLVLRIRPRDKFKHTNLYAFSSFYCGLVIPFIVNGHSLLNHIWSAWKAHVSLLISSSGYWRGVRVKWSIWGVQFSGHLLSLDNKCKININTSEKGFVTFQSEGSWLTA